MIMITNLFFYLFAILTILSSIGVVSARNPIYAVLYLIFAFCNSAGLMILLGAEFLAMILIIVYVGAVAVLFLFIVMMLDTELKELKDQFTNNWLISSIIATLGFINICAIVLLGLKKSIHNNDVLSTVTNTHAIGQVLYTDYILPFQICGLILFAAMIACIALTLRHRVGIKRQNIADQLQRNRENSLKLSKLDIRIGLKNLDYDK